MKTEEIIESMDKVQGCIKVCLIWNRERLNNKSREEIINLYDEDRKKGLLVNFEHFKKCYRDDVGLFATEDADYDFGENQIEEIESLINKFIQDNLRNLAYTNLVDYFNSGYYDFFADRLTERFKEKFVILVPPLWHPELISTIRE